MKSKIKHKKTNVIRILHFILGVLILSGFGFALTTVTDNGVTVTTGNVTADWFKGKVNASDIQNDVFNYNQTIASGDGSFNSTYAQFAYNQSFNFGSSQYNLTYPDTTLTINSNKSLLAGTPSSGGINFVQSIPQAKGGIWWSAYDSASNSIRPVVWLVAHYNSTGNAETHQHFSIETLDNSTGTPTINSHLTITYNSSQSVANVAFPNSVVRSMAVDDIFSAGGDNIDLKSDINVRIFPSLQTTIGLSVSNNSNNITLTGLGTSNIELLDNLHLRNNNITASYFIGDGSLLTNLPGSSNIFNQNLNNTNEVQFTSINASLSTSSGNRAPALNIVSRNQNQSAVWITGNESDKGTLKIAHTGYVGDDTSSAISIDLQGTGTSAKGIYITTSGATNNSLLSVNDGTFNIMDLFPQLVRFYKNVQITNTSANAFLVEKGDGTDIFKIDTSSDLVFTGNLRPRTNITYDVGQLSVPYREGYFEQNVTARYFKGDGSLLTGITANGAFNSTYQATSNDVTANRTAWFNNYNVSYENKSATGSCPAGFVVQNTTTSGVQCVPASTSTTNDGITINGANITAGTIALARLPILTDTHTLNIANITNFIYNYNATSPAITYINAQGFLTTTNVAFTNISNNFARSQNVSGNITIRTGDNVCLDGDACTKRIYYNGSNVIIQG